MSVLITETDAADISHAQLDPELVDAVNTAYPLSGCQFVTVKRGVDINDAPDPAKDQFTFTFNGAPPTLVQIDAVIAAFIAAPPTPVSTVGLPLVDDGTPDPDFAQIDIDAATLGSLPPARIDAASASNGHVLTRVAGVPTWQAPAVQSVAGKTGAVLLGVADVSGAAPLASPPFTGTPTGPTAPADTATTQLATTAYVQTELADYALASALAAKVDASGGTLTGGTIDGATSISGTATAAGGATIALAGATAVTVPTVAFPDSDTSAASTAFVTAGLATRLAPPASDDAYYVIRNGVWVAAYAPDYLLTGGVGAAIAGTTLTTYISGTSGTLIAGTYQVEWSVTSLHASSSSIQGVQVTVGGSNMPTAVVDGYAGPSNNSRTQVSNVGTYVHGGGTIAVVMQVRRTSGSGNVTPQSGIVTIRRIS